MANFNVYLLVMASAFFWGANFVLAGYVLNDLPPLWAAALRFLLGAALMFAISGFRREEVLSLARRHAPAYVMLGTVGIVLFNVFFFYALQTTSAANAALIMATNPLLTTLLAAAILGERPAMRHLAALPVALIGVGVVIVHGDVSQLTALKVSRGDLLMLVANTAWALYNVLARRYMPQASPLGNTTWVMSVGAALLFGVALASGAPVAALGGKAALALALMAVGGTVLAYLFWTIGIMRLGAARTSIFLNLVPVFAMLLGMAFGTTPTMAQLAGGALVLGAVTLSMAPSRATAKA